MWHGDVAQRVGKISSARGVRVWPSSGVGAGEAQAEAHMEHCVHGCDAGGVKTQRLVESIRKLPSPKGATDRGRRVWHAEVWHRGKGKSAAHAACFCVAQLGSGGRRRRRKRTENIAYMVVTLEVSRLSGWLKASAACRVQRGQPTEGRRVWHTEMWHRGKGESAAHAACVRGPARECG